MSKITVGEATIRLLGRYGVDTVFGIPGVHTLAFCRGLGPGSAVRHVQARNEMGAGFMADGYARTSGRPGVALVISGPGVTNAATPLGQSFADSIPMLLISADAATETLGKGWGVLHEVTDLHAVTRPLTAFSAGARRAEDVPELLARAFGIFASARPRPVHISIPIDVLEAMTDGDWQPVVVPGPARPDPGRITAAAAMLARAGSPMILVGGGATGAGGLTALAERTGAIVITSTAGKGIIADDHPQSLGAVTVRNEARELMAEADVILALGTELSETDSFVPRLPIKGQLVRVDLDPAKMNDLYPAALPIVADAAATVDALLVALGSGAGAKGAAARVAGVKAEIAGALAGSEPQHARFLDLLAGCIDDDVCILGDVCQLVYSGAFLWDARKPRKWHYPAGFCTLGPGLPNAIGAKYASPDARVMVLAGDGGAMFTIQEMVTGAEGKLPIPVVIWENGGLKQIQDDMRAQNVPRVGVDGLNPDYMALARAMHCHAEEPASAEEFRSALEAAFEADRPTLILVHESMEWLS